MTKHVLILKIMLTPLIVISWVVYRLWNNWLINPDTLKEYWEEF